MSLIELLAPEYVKTKLDNVDVALSTRASETTLSGIKAQTDKLSFDGSNRLYINAAVVANPPNLDVALSTRLSESTFTGRFPSAVALGDSLANPTTTIVGGALLGWDSASSVWERIHTDGSNRLKVQLDSIPNPSNLDVALSTRASETTLSGIKTQTDKFTFDASNRLYVNAAVVANPSNLDVALSTRASESTLSTFSGKFPAAAALGDALANPTTTIIGGALLGFDGTNWRRVTAISKDISGGNRNALTVIASISHDITRMPYMVENINVGTTEGSTAIAAPGAKFVKIVNKGDVDVLIGVNGSVPSTNPLKIRPRTLKIFMFGGATAIYYKTASGTSTIDIEWWN